MAIRTEGAYTERDYKGYIIAHLHGASFEVHAPNGQVLYHTSTLKEAKRVVDKYCNM